MATSPFSRREERTPPRLWLVPILSTLAGSLVALAPVVPTVPLMPPFGLLLLLGWRLLRPELWGAWVALPLGLADDLVSGAPLGSAMATWTIVLLALDFADHRVIWRDFWMDWVLATLALGFAVAAAWALTLFAGGSGPFWTATAQWLLAALLFPGAARLCRDLDRWRLQADRLGGR